METKRLKIIAKSDKNVIKLTTTADYNKYEILDLSNHEAIHKSASRKKLIQADQDDYYMVDGSEKGPEDENNDSSGA